MVNVAYDGEAYDPDKVITAREAAAIAKVNGHTIGNWIRKGYLPALRPGGPYAPYRIVVGDLIAHLTGKA